MSVKLCLPQLGQGTLWDSMKAFISCVGEGVDRLGQLDALLLGEVLDELVRAEALVALAAVHERVGEAAQMAGGHPGLRVHQDGGVQTHVVGVLLHEFLPPGALDVVLELHAQRAVVPGVGKAAVDFAARKIKPRFLHRATILSMVFSVFFIKDDFTAGSFV
jgi:hypothetical protein